MKTLQIARLLPNTVILENLSNWMPNQATLKSSTYSSDNSLNMFSQICNEAITIKAKPTPLVNNFFPFFIFLKSHKKATKSVNHKNGTAVANINSLTINKLLSTLKLNSFIGFNSVLFFRKLNGLLLNRSFALIVTVLMVYLLWFKKKARLRKLKPGYTAIF